MHTNYFTLKALAEEWNGFLKGAVIVDAFSQTKDELRIVVRDPESMLQLSTHPAPDVRAVEGHELADRFAIASAAYPLAFGFLG
jgi:hypothetical protein